MTQFGAHRIAQTLLGALVLCLALPSAADQAQRWAVVAGHNLGTERTTLKFAEEDARRVGQALIRPGQFDPQRVKVLLGPTPEKFLATIHKVAQMANQAPPVSGSVLFVFFSGHGDGNHLILGNDKLGIQELKEALNETNMDVVVLVLDACKSGSATRHKGGKSAPAFLRFFDTPRARGRVILTSASASEMAQESDDIGSSFFTHFFVSGLLGDADRSQDGRVTLSEIYRYVYDHTVIRTANTLSGVQHPAFLYELEGEGHLVLADLNSENTGLVLPESSTGNYLVFDRNRRYVVAELHKKPGTRRLIPVAPGKYTLKKRQTENLLVAKVEVRDHERLVVTDDQMLPTDFEHRTAKGWDLCFAWKPSPIETDVLMSWTAFSRAPAGGIWSYPSIGLATRFQGWPWRGFRSRLAFTAGAWQHSLPINNENISFRLLQLGSDFSLGRTLYYGPSLFEFGGRLAINYLRRSFNDQGVSTQDSSLGGGLAAFALVATRVGLVRLALEASGGLFLFPGAKNTAIPYINGSLTTGLNW